MAPTCLWPEVNVTNPVLFATVTANAIDYTVTCMLCPTLSSHSNLVNLHDSVTICVHLRTKTCLQYARKVFFQPHSK